MNTPWRWQRPARVLIAGGLVAAVGCQTSPPRRVESRPEASRATLDASTGIRSDRGVVRAGFPVKPGVEQEAGLHLDLGRGHESTGRVEAAAVDYQKALDALEKPGRAHGSSRPITEQRATAHRKLAGMLDRLGKFAQADVHYKAALKLAPDDPKVWNNAGYSYYLQGRYAEAERTLRTAARLAPDEPRVATNLGLALAASGKRDEAFQVLAKAGGPAAAHANIAYVLAATGHRDDAAAEYRGALAIQPDLPVALAGLAQLGKGGAGALLADLPMLPDDPRVKKTSAAR